jgi:polycomb protein EED
MRFSIFHEIGQHPVLVAGNQKSKAFFWDLQRVEESGTGEAAFQTGLLSLPRHIREGSSSSLASSTISAGSGTTKTQRKKTKELPRDRGIADPFRSIRAHKIIEVPKYAAFPFRQFSWSRDGQWCVGVGDGGMINVFNRWEQGVPPLKTDSEITLSIREK